MMQYGNPLGYALAVAIVIATLFTGYKLDALDAATAATEFSRDPNTLAELKLPVAPRTVVAADDTDATSIYADALSRVQGNRRLYENFTQIGKDRDITNLTALPLLLDAASHGGFKLVAQHPDEAFSYDSEKPVIDDLKLLGKCANRVALLLKATDASRAKTYAEAQFALGARFFEERINHTEMYAGLEMMADAAALLKALPGASPAVASFDAGRLEAAPRIDKMWEIIGTIDTNKIALHNGDLFVIARDARERLWRIEAILKLGRMKYEDGVQRADSAAAARLLKQLAESDPDPIIKAAATRAANLTIQDFRRIG